MKGNGQITNLDIDGNITPLRTSSSVIYAARLYIAIDLENKQYQRLRKVIRHWKEGKKKKIYKIELVLLETLSPLPKSQFLQRLNPRPPFI